MAGLDTVDLQILDQLAKTGNLSRTGERVGLSQPSVSLRLGRLRKHFKDPLFVRTTDGMQPTPRADVLIAASRHALELFDGTFAPPEIFDPTTSERVFRICMTDIGQIVILPKLLNRLSTVACGIRLEVSNLSEDMSRMLESGEADIAMGLTLPMQNGLYQQALFEEQFVCMASKDHPRIGKRLTRRQFLDEAYVAVDTPVSGHWVLDAALADQNIVRRIALRVPAFLGLSRIVASTELLAIVPRHLGKAFAQLDQVRLLSAPVALPSYWVKQYWHQRYHADPGHKWMRGLISNLFTS